MKSRLYKIHKQFDPVVGHGYGLKNTQNQRFIYRDVSGQAFWRELTGDPDFYLKLIRAMRDEPQKHGIEFKNAWEASINRFIREFTIDFCYEDGSIDWEKLTKFVSEESRN
jgi:Type II restriction endonuclease EcoO109I